MKRILFDCGTREGSTSFALFVLRAATGLMLLIGHGLRKIENFDTMKEGFYKPDFFPLHYMSPQVSLMAIIAVEVVAAAMLVLGLMTRWAAFAIGFAMVVAAFGRHAADPFFMGAGASKEPALLYLIPAVTILLAGAGAWSLDALLYRDSKRWRR